MPEILRMPEISANLVEAVLDSWNVGVDQPYQAGEPIVTVETDKAVVDVEAEQPGVLLRVLVEAGSTVPVGAPIAIWGTGGEAAADVEAVIASLGADAAPQPEAEAQPEPTAEPAAAQPVAPGPEATTDVVRLFASPLARRLARERGLDLSTLTGTGPRGRIRRVDVEAAAALPPPAVAAPTPEVPVGAASSDGRVLGGPAPGGPASFTDEPNSRMRQAIARRLTESKQTVPHFYVRGSARVDALLALRQQLNEGAASKVSVNDLLVKAIAQAHAEVPAMNVQWNEDSIRHFENVDVAVAVATDGGLVTPVVRGVDGLSVSRVAAATADLIARAKDRRLRQDELEGGSISITNLGMYGTEDFAAIINPPQAAILAVGAARPEPVVADGEVVVAQVLHVTLAVDHRPVDGATAAIWMRAFLAIVENPLRILL
ncbi:MAG: 2-oxo acid dehydrogenase subunit E2 [Nocardioidaceae bacterium]|nr:2-oxo acid dehydrogenase subunit E2 [Nocardioidaceae bacterium]